MKGILTFMRTSPVGGILLLLPVVMAVIFAGNALTIAHKTVSPLAAHLAMESVIALLVLFCFLTGVFARTALLGSQLTASNPSETTPITAVGSRKTSP